jgi:hypothetical protein
LGTLMLQAIPLQILKVIYRTQMKSLLYILLFLLFCTPLQAYRLGGETGLLTGTTLRNQPSQQIRLFAETDRLTWGQFQPSAYVDYTFFPLAKDWVQGLRQMSVVSIGLNHTLFMYGPRTYALQAGYEFLPSYTSGYANTQRLYVRGTYEEEILFGVHLKFFGKLALNITRGASFTLHPELGVSLAMQYDSDPEYQQKVKLTYVDMNQILAQALPVSAQADVESLTLKKSYQVFADYQKSTTIKLPKFIQKDKPFVATKKFSKNAQIAKVNCKIAGISNTLFPFKQVSDTIWQAEITLPPDFNALELKIHLFYKTKDGVVFDEYASTLIE